MSTQLHEHLSQVRKAADWLSREIKDVPDVAIITGSSGPQDLARHFEKKDWRGRFGNEIDFPPSLPKPQLHGHVPKMFVGWIKGTSVLWIRGRVHFNECPDNPYRHVGMVRALGLFGVKSLILTNAAGSLNSRFGVGDICVIKDHNSKFMGHNPLAGDPELIEKELKVNFHVGMNPVYDRELLELAMYCGEASTATYLMVPGPEFETACEARMFKDMADLMGMSSIPEAMVAKQLGMSVATISLVTNRIPLEVNMSDNELSHRTVMEVVTKNNKRLATYLAGFINRIGKAA